MDLLTTLTWIGAAITLIGTTRYIIGILKDGTKPRLASWIAWLTSNGVLTIVAFMDGAYLPALFNALAVVGNIGVLIAASRQKAGRRPSGTTDWLCLSAALACLVLMISFPEIAVFGAIMAMAANLIATWPTIIHAWQKPFEETWHLFLANISACTLAMIGVVGSVGWELALIAGPLVTMSGNFILIFITLGRRYAPSVLAELEKDVAELSGPRLDLDSSAE
jgi:hypothetical protein